MKKVALYSLLLIAGLIGSQVVPGFLGDAADSVYKAVQILTMVALSYIMIGVGREFEIDKSNLKQYGWDYVVAATAAGFPWIFCCLYFVFVLIPSDFWSQWPVWKESLLASRFAAPTSAGVLFSMLAAAGLAATWVFKKARILAIFDDLDTVLLMIPLKMAMVGMKWQLGIVVFVMFIMLWFGYRYLHQWRIPTSWKATLVYSFVMVAIVEAVYIASKKVDPMVPIHIEVLLPAFILGCMMAHPKPNVPPGQGHAEGHDAGQADHGHHADPAEARASTFVSAAFMLLVGLSMPSIAASLAGGAPDEGDKSGLIKHALAEHTPPMGWGTIAFHVLVVTVISNVGKMFPAFCYRREATWQERCAVAIGMWPRGEVGAGVLVISLAYGIAGPIVVIAMLSLALNLVLTGVFIFWVKKLLASAERSGKMKAA
ncbi:MAG: sodium:proton antiporter [Phycisphaeraceae bacterium]|nr:MAG: sodium:proton antiporter [Phycisphaeraceae bacterium]